MVIDKLIPFIVNIDEINSIEPLYDTPNSLNILDVSSEAGVIVAEQSHPLATPSLWIGTSDGPGLL